MPSITFSPIDDFDRVSELLTRHAIGRLELGDLDLRDVASMERQRAAFSRWRREYAAGHAVTLATADDFYTMQEAVEGAFHLLQRARETDTMVAENLGWEKWEIAVIRRIAPTLKPILDRFKAKNPKMDLPSWQNADWRALPDRAPQEIRIAVDGRIVELPAYQAHLLVDTLRGDQLGTSHNRSEALQPPMRGTGVPVPTFSEPLADAIKIACTEAMKRAAGPSRTVRVSIHAADYVFEADDLSHVVDTLRGYRENGARGWTEDAANAGREYMRIKAGQPTYKSSSTNAVEAENALAMQVSAGRLAWVHANLATALTQALGNGLSYSVTQQTPDPAKPLDGIRAEAEQPIPELHATAQSKVVSMQLAREAKLARGPKPMSF